jgi:CRP-like cAMP-binding protein
MSLLGRDRPVLELLDHADRAAFLGAGAPRHYPDGETICVEGDPTSFVVAITSGWAVVSVVTERGHRLILAIRGPGDLIGEVAALDGEPRSATVRALGDTGGVLLTGERFRAFLATHPAATQLIMRSLGARLRDSDAARRALVSSTVLQRMARLLVELAGRGGSGTPDGTLIDLSLPQHDLAALIGATREGAAKALRVLRESGVVLTGPKRVVVAHPELLTMIGNDSSAFPGAV